MPEIAAPTLAPVDKKALATMGVCGRGHRLGGWRYQDHVDVVWASGTKPRSRRRDYGNARPVARRRAGSRRHRRTPSGAGCHTGSAWCGTSETIARRRTAMAPFWPKPERVKRVLWPRISWARISHALRRASLRSTGFRRSFCAAFVVRAWPMPQALLRRLRHYQVSSHRLLV